MTELDLRADVIDVRDIIERIEEIDRMADDVNDPAWRNENESEAEEFDALHAIMAELAGEGGDEQWRGEWYPLTLIRDSYMEDYARELSEDIGAIDRNATWPNNYIDWEAATDALRMDYTAIEIDGITYQYR